MRSHGIACFSFCARDGAVPRYHRDGCLPIEDAPRPYRGRSRVREPILQRYRIADTYTNPGVVIMKFYCPGAITFGRESRPDGAWTAGGNGFPSPTPTAVTTAPKWQAEASARNRARWRCWWAASPRDERRCRRCRARRGSPGARMPSPLSSCAG